MYPITNSATYPPEVIKAFQEGRAKDILNKYLYSFRSHTEDEAFHVLMGLCMYKMGYYEEAHAAFVKAQKVAPEGSHKGDVLDALVMLMAQREEEATEKLKNIPLKELNINEVITVMSIKNKLGLPMEDELLIAVQHVFPTKADCMVMGVFAYKYAFGESELFEDMASVCANELYPYMFQDFKTYLYAVTEIYKLHMQDEADTLLARVPIEDTNDNEADMFLDYIKTCYACGYYNRMTDEQRKVLFNIAGRRHRKAVREKWRENLSRLYCMEYDRIEKTDKEQEKMALIRKMKSLHTKSEQVLLYISTYDFEHFQQEKWDKIRHNVEKLITLNQTNIRYRKLYCDLLKVMGFLRQSDEVALATIDMRKKEEYEEFSLVSSFRSFYIPKTCMMKYMPVHEHDDGKDCPICFGSGSHPIIRAIGTGYYDSPIFTENFEKKVIQPNEAMLKDLVNWQPMNVSSPIVGKFLLSQGAYISPREYPDVLVPGQTYLYLSLKPEAEQRLKAEGYSRLQIDPFLVAADPTVDGGEGKEITDIPVSADDFNLEIVHAISPQHELDNAPSMPMPEQYIPTENN